MRRIFAVAIVIGLGLSACASLPTAGGVQARVLQVCGWIEPLTNLATVIAASPITMSIDALADTICAAAATIRTAKRGARAPTVNGIPLQGSFVTR